MNQYQINLANIIKAHLDPNDAGFTGSESVRAALEATSLYLNTYVMPLVDHLASGGKGQVYAGHREHASNDASRIHTRRAARARKRLEGAAQ